MSQKSLEEMIYEAAEEVHPRRSYMAESKSVKHPPGTTQVDPSGQYPEIRGMEGPIRMRDGRILYYDPREGAYYDRRKDMYLDRDEVTESLQEGASTERIDVGNGWAVIGVRIGTRGTPRTPRSGGSPSDGKGWRQGWKIDGPWDYSDSMQSAIRSMTFDSKKKAIDKAKELAG